MKKREADFGTLFRHWLKANPIISAAFELKQTKKAYIAFSEVKDHQLEALQAAQSKQGILYKAPDDSRGIKPFDYFYLRNALSFVVIKYRKFFVLIEVDEFIKEKKKSLRKSLTEAKAKEIASLVIELSAFPKQA